MPAILVQAIELSWNRSGAALASSVDTNMRRAQMGSDTNPNWGQWLGPAPRVTRHVIGPTGRVFQLVGAWVYQWPDTQFATTHQAFMQNQLLESLRTAFGEGWTITAVPYDPTLHGTVAWWQTEAANTQTRDSFPGIIGGLMTADENPIGPTTAATHPPSPTELITNAGNWLSDHWWIFAILAGLFVVSKVPAFKLPSFGGGRKRSKPRGAISAAGFRVPAGAHANGFFSSFDTVRLTTAEWTRWKREPKFRARLGGMLAKGARGTGRTVHLVGPRAQYVSTFAAEANPRPSAWSMLPAGTEYGCKGKHVGAVVKMRRGGGTVRTCATPSKEHPKEGQYAIGLPGVGFTARKSAVSRALRPRRELDDEYRRPKTDPATEAALVEDFDRQRIAAHAAGAYIPQPTELEFPHAKGSSRCDVYHPLWQEMQRVVEAMPATYETTDVARALRQHPRWVDWVAAEDVCVTQWRGRARRARAKAGFSQQREVAQRRQAALERGEDVTGAEYRDTLRSAQRRRNGLIGGR
jgi:hypothetical protein